MKKNHLFLKYLLVNLCLLFIISVGCLVNVFYTYNVEKNNILEQNENILERSVSDFEDMLNSIYSISSALRSNTSLQQLSRFKGEELPADMYVLANYFKKDLSDIQMIANISANGFALFRDNPVFVSNTQIAVDFEEYYGTYLEAEGMTALEFRQEILDCTEFITCKTYPSMKVFDSGVKTLENPFVVVVRIREANNLTLITKTMAFVFVIDQEEIFQKLFSGSSKENLICICDRNGNELSAFGEGAGELCQYANVETEKENVFYVGKEGYYLQQMKDSVNGNSVILAVPTKQVKIQTFHLLRVNLIVLGITILVSIAAIIALSYQKSSSMQGVIDHINKHSKTEFVAGNEYKFIQKNVEFLADSRDVYQKELAELRNQMEKNLMEQMFLQETLSTKVGERYKELIPFELQYYYVMILQCQEEDAELLLKTFYMLDKCAEQFINGKHLCIQTSVNEMSFLIARNDNERINKEQEAEKLQQFLQMLTEETAEVFHIGISGIGMEFSNIHNCYIQARQALTSYAREHMNTVGYYADLLNVSGEKMINMDYLSKLYQYLICGKRDLFEDSLDKLMRHYRLTPYMYEKDTTGIYYSLRQTVVCAATELSIPEEILQLRKWSSSFGLEKGITDLKEAASCLFAANEENKKSHNDTLKERITEYIEKNFHDSNLTAAVVCQTMKISEKYLMQFLKEQTGKTFAKYLEDMRIEKAKELLLNTEDSNEKIAKDVGFGSVNSFYRVFNKRTGVSPGTFRKK